MVTLHGPKQNVPTRAPLPQVSLQGSPMVVHCLVAGLVAAPPLQGKILGTKPSHLILHHHAGCKVVKGGPGMQASPLTLERSVQKSSVGMLCTLC